MPENLDELNARVQGAVASGRLLPAAAKNLHDLAAVASDSVALKCISELVDAEQWDELNDRFYKTLEFGTGGLRGRTIGKVVTAAERGNAAPDARPEFPCIGTNAMNYFNVSRATQGLVAYVKEWSASRGIGFQPMNRQTDRDHRQPPSPSYGVPGAADPTRPAIVIAHDTRFFSKAFTDLAAKVAAENGCDAFVFDGPRSTPELSFTVRYLNAAAGIVITASHNPPHDNGYKAYFADGAQVIEPHASGIIAKVESIHGGAGSIPSQKFKDDTEVVPPQGQIITLGHDVDEAYMKKLESLVINPNLIREAKSLRIVFTPLHGTGGVTLKPMLTRLGFNFEMVPEQQRFDPRFSTVKSPNPENAEALRMGIELANETKADLVIATDPDCDRLGVAVRNAQGAMELISGNRIGSLLAYYRIQAFFKAGVLNRQNASRAVLITTFVTTRLQKVIAEHYGVRCVETLTGFKYFGAKLEKYERALPTEVQKRYRQLSEEESRRARLEHSSFYVFGSEESYGYSGADFVRDKDGNAGAIMFCEMAAYARSKGQTVDRLLDEIFCQLGYFDEKNESIYFEGAEGAEKIERLLGSYEQNLPTEIGGSRVVSVQDFEKDTIRDVEGDEIPKQKMLIFDLADKTRIAVRGSGTEPKIKYYIFGEERPKSGSRFTQEELARIKNRVGKRLETVWEWIRKDVDRRLS